MCDIWFRRLVEDIRLCGVGVLGSMGIGKLILDFCKSSRYFNYFFNLF